MAKIVHRYQDKKLPPNLKIIETATGEIKTTQGSVFIRKSTGKINVEYKEFLYLNIEGLRILLSKGIKQVELGLLLTLCSNLKQNENICMQDTDEPHTTLSIAKLSGNTKQATKIKLNSLIKMGILDYSKALVKMKLKKVYRINPHIIKKGIDLDNQLATMFDDIV